MPLGTQVGLGPGDIVSDRDPATPMERSQLVFWGFRHISISGLGVCASRASLIAVFWQPLQVTVRCMLRDHSSVCPICNIGVLWPNGWMEQDATWCGGRPRPMRHCVRWEPSSPHQKGTTFPHFSGHVYCGQTVAHLSNC